MTGSLAACAQEPEEGYAEARARLVTTLTRALFGRTPIQDQRVLDAIGRVQRHRFVPPERRALAYKDHPLPIGHDQTISQPYIVAIMTEALQPEAGDRVLEIGTGSGYQAAVLAELVREVYTIEIVAPLGENAKTILADLGYDNVHVRIGDGYKGWPERAPFDKIIVTAAPDHIPQPLIDQLKPGGRLVIPVGGEHDTQELLLLTKQADGEIAEERLEYVRFVPMTGEAKER